MPDEGLFSFYLDDGSPPFAKSPINRRVKGAHWRKKVWSERGLNHVNLLRNAVESRKKQIIHTLLAALGDRVKERELQSLTLTELEEEWKRHLNAMKGEVSRMDGVR